MSRLAAVSVAVACAVPAVLFAAGITVPYTFHNGEVADADAVNENFSVLAAGVNAHDTRIASLEAGGTAGSVPPNVTWSSDSESGNSACAKVGGLCSSASCGTVSASGSAACVESAGLTAGVTWDSDTESGNSRCTQQELDCVQAYDASGNPFGCSAILTSGAAACGPRANWDRGVSWTGSDSGDRLCARQNAICTLAYDASGANVACGTFSTNGRARCRKTTTADTWQFHVSWAGTGESGNQQCAIAGGVCVGTRHSDGNSYPCATNVGASSNNVLALCRNRTAADGWDSVVTWAGRNGAGDVECADVGKECVGIYHLDGNSYPCSMGVGAPTNKVTATCRARTAADPWTATAAWSERSGNGTAECAQQRDMACVVVHHSTAGTRSCTEALGAAGNRNVAKCRPRVAGDGWDKVATWSNRNGYPLYECAVQQAADCVQVAHSTAGMLSCASGSGASGNSVVALCKTPTTWNKAVVFTAGPTTDGNQQCSANGATCVGVVAAGDGATYGCTASLNGGGVAKCRTP